MFIRNSMVASLCKCEKDVKSWNMVNRAIKNINTIIQAINKLFRLPFLSFPKFHIHTLGSTKTASHHIF